MKSLLILITTSLLSILLLSSCAKQTKATKPYHNLTGRYNAYYNADMRLTESFDILNNQYRDNYNKLLEMYPYAAVSSIDGVKQPLDEAITKCARNVELHRIGNWTDNSYLLMGKAEFLLKKYERCAATFKYIVEKYHPDNVAKEEAKLKKKKKRKKRKRKRRRRRRKKKRKKKNKKAQEEEIEKPVGGIKHRPSRFEAILWLAKSYIELEMYDEAGYHLRQLENDPKTPYKLRPQVQAVIAYSWVQQKEYEKAIEPLEKAIATTKRKIIKNRYAYLLAQLYQMKNNSELAMEYFRKVLRWRPSYEMEFNARLNMVKNAASVSGKKPINPELALKRMLRDAKNEEYKDQIYFALAQIKLKQGKVDEGIATLQKSLNYGNNPMQRTEGCLLLAELFYDKEKYVQSYAYYDSTLITMKKEDERYVTTETYKKRLKGVATNLALVEQYDSMLVIGNWEPKKQEVWAIRNMELDEQQAQNGGRQPTNGPNNKKKGVERWAGATGVNRTNRNNGNPQRGNRQSSGGVTINQNAVQKSKFALYNSNLKRKGQREFQKRWGDRSWADNWRRSNKNTDEAIDNQEIAEAPPKTQAEIDAYLKKRGVPQNEADKKKVEKKLAKVIYKAASHYHEDLGEASKAMELVGRLTNDYPQSEYAVEGLFLAYNIYFAKNNQSKAEYYKNEILTKYPETNIAKVLQDPDFANAQQKKYNAINEYYNETYDLIQKGKNQDALERIKQVSDIFGDNYEMKARFAILEAMCVGGIKGENEYIRALRVVVTSFPDTKEEEQAIAMLAVLTDKKPKKNTITDKRNSLVPFRTNKKQKHNVIILFNNKRTRVNRFRGPVTNFNTKYYPDGRHTVSTILMDGKLPAVVVRNFKDGEAALQYAADIQSRADMFSGTKGFDVYAISRQNYNLALSTQNFSAYIPFYEKHYKSK